MEKLFYIYFIGIGISTIQCYIMFELLIPYKVRPSILLTFKILHNLVVSVLLALILAEGLKLSPAFSIYQIPLGEFVLFIYLLGELVIFKKQIQVKYEHIVDNVYNYKLHSLSILISMGIFTLFLFNPTFGKTTFTKPFLVLMQTKGMNNIIAIYGMVYFIYLFKCGLTEGLSLLFNRRLTS